MVWCTSADCNNDVKFSEWYWIHLANALVLLWWLHYNTKTFAWDMFDCLKNNANFLPLNNCVRLQPCRSCVSLTFQHNFNKLFDGEIPENILLSRKETCSALPQTLVLFASLINQLRHYSSFSLSCVPSFLCLIKCIKRISQLSYWS